MGTPFLLSTQVPSGPEPVGGGRMLVARLENCVLMLYTPQVTGWAPGGRSSGTQEPGKDRPLWPFFIPRLLCLRTWSRDCSSEYSIILPSPSCHRRFLMPPCHFVRHFTLQREPERKSSESRELRDFSVNSLRPHSWPVPSGAHPGSTGGLAERVPTFQESAVY